MEYDQGHPDDVQQHSLGEIISIYRVPIALGLVSIILIVVSITLLIKSVQPARPIQFSQTNTANDAGNVEGASISATIPILKIDMGGAVMKPGVVEVQTGARVEDAIIQAGGLSANADTDYIEKNINRAMKVADGMKIYIPVQGETSHNISPVLQRPDGMSQNSSGVSINIASKSELDVLPGVGPVTAQKIIDNRPYANLEDLVTKKAVGQSLFNKIKNQLTL